MRRIELARRVTPDSAQALWIEIENGLDSTDVAAGGLLLDAAGVQYLSAAGLQVLLVVAARLEAEGARLQLRSPSPAFRQALHQMGADHLLAGAVL